MNAKYTILQKVAAKRATENYNYIFMMWIHENNIMF